MRKLFLILVLFTVSSWGYAQTDRTTIDSLMKVPLESALYQESSNSVTLDPNIPPVIPPSPHAAELGRYGANPVGLYTGTVQHSIPIFELKNENLNLPISLNYSSNGLKVDKLASWVGYDWSLNAGGIINRYRKGKTDLPGTRPYNDFNSLSTDEKINFLDNIVTHEKDLMPDIFSINLPNYSGKLVFNHEGNPILVPFAPILVETDNSGSFQHFQITTPDGIIYKFEDTDASYPPNEIPFYTSWHLSKIIHPTGDSITFSYSRITIAQKIGINRKVLLKVAVSGEDPQGACNNSEFLEQITTQNYSICFLNSIEFHGIAKVFFDKSLDRLDSPLEYKLDRIRLEDPWGNQIKSCKLNYQFANQHNFPCTLAGATDELNYRMFLEFVEMLDSEGKMVNSYGFEYNDTYYLPARFSYAQDHWGYFNGKSNNDIISIDEVPPNYKGLFTNHIGSVVDRSANHLYSKKGMLNKIIYPTRGYSTFEYEANMDAYGNEIGGCRVLRIKNYDSSDSLSETKKLNYLSVATSNTLQPIYYNQFSTYFNYGEFPSNFYGECVFGVLSSNSLNNIYIDGQNFVCYPSVEVLQGENGENGRKRYDYNIVYDTPGTPINGGIIYPIPMSNNGWSSGKLENVVTENNKQAEIRREETIYNYSEARNSETINCYAIERRPSPHYTPGGSTYKLSFYDVVPYYIYSNWLNVSSKAETNYDSNGFIKSTTTFNYNNSFHAQVTKKTVTNSNKKTLETNYSYPQDYVSTSNFSTLIDKNIIAKPIDVRTYNNSELISGTQTQYNDFGQPIQSLSLERKAGDPDIPFNSGEPFTFTPKANYTYNVDKLLAQISPSNNFNTSFFWAYNNTYPVIKVENAFFPTLDFEVQQSLPEGYTTLDDLVTDLDDIATNEAKQTLWKEFNSNLKNQTTLFNTMISTYTYKPLVGITSQTGPDGRTIYYEYDSFGRLKLTRNHLNEIINKYEYHYAGQ